MKDKIASYSATMTPTEHEKLEIMRMAADAHARGVHPELVTRCGAFASCGTTFHGSVTLAEFDSLMAIYRGWLLAGFDGYGKAQPHPFPLRNVS